MVFSLRALLGNLEAEGRGLEREVALDIMSPNFPWEYNSFISSLVHFSQNQQQKWNVLREHEFFITRSV